MKKLTLIVTIIFSLSIFAQVKTGGTPSLGLITIINEVENGRDDVNSVLKGNLRLLAIQLKRSDAACSIVPRLKNEKELIQIHITLSLISSVGLMAERCEDNKRYLSCIRTDEVKRTAKETKEEIRRLQKENKEFDEGKELENMMDFYIKNVEK